MYLLEAIFIVVSAALLFGINTSWLSTRTCNALFIAGFAVVVLALLVGQARIHMVPVLLVFLVSSLFLMKHSRAHIALRSLGVAIGLVLTSTSVVLAFGLPIVSLPAPQGPYSVGVHSFNLIDETRFESAFGGPGRNREIYVQAWYPADTTADASTVRARSLWQELYRFPVFDVLFGYLNGIKTHSYEQAPLAIQNGPFPAVIFSPSIGGTAEQNTLLMEHLASNGYIVFGLTHLHFGTIGAYSDGEGVATHPSVVEATTEQGAVDLEAIRNRAELTSDPIQRSLIWLEYFERGTLLSEFMDTWVGDIQLLLDAVVSGREEGLREADLFGSVSIDQIGLLGMSYGGGAVTETCKRDNRCRAVINLDGGLWGSRMREPSAVPHLVLASPGNSMFFEHGLLTAEAPYYLGVVEGTAHLDFTDAPIFAPLLDWLGATGQIEGDRVIEIVNVVSKRFFDAYLRNDRPRSIGFPEFPELNLRTNRTESN